MSVNINSPLEAMQSQANLHGFAAAQMQRIGRLLNMFEYARRMRAPHEPRWKKNKEYYLSIDKEIKARPEHASKLFIPRPYLVVETKVPKLVQALVSGDNIWTVLPKSADDILKARVSQELLNHYWSDQDNIVHEMVTWFKDSFIYGSSIGRTGWEFKQELTPTRVFGQPYIDPFSMQLVEPQAIEEVMSITADRPTFQNVDVSKFWVDPHATTIEKANYCIEQHLVSRNQLKMLEAVGVYQHIDMVPKGAPTVTPGEFQNQQLSLSNIGSTNNTDTTIQDPEYDLIELLEIYWMEGDRRMKTVIANRQVIIQDIPLPFWHGRWPYYKLNDVPITGEFYGLGSIDPIMDLTKELNEMRNQQNDNRNQFLKAFWYVNRAANIDLDMLQDMPPGGIIEGTGSQGEALSILRPPPLDSMTFAGQQQIDSDIQMTTGANDIAIGTSTRSQIRTATTGSLMAESTNARFALNGLLYIEQMKKVGKDWLSLTRQFMSQPVAVRILGQDGLNFEEIMARPEDVINNYDLNVAMVSELQGDRELQKQQALQLFQLMAGVPGYQITEGAKELLRKYNYKAPERFFEGNITVPTGQIMQQLGFSNSPQQSNYLEQMGGLIGGGTQINPGIDRAGMLETAMNPGVTPNVG